MPPKKRIKPVNSGTTSVDEGHNHTYTLDAKGNGRTSTDSGHSHSIREGAVKPAGKNNHTHTL